MSQTINQEAAAESSEPRSGGATGRHSPSSVANRDSEALPPGACPIHGMGVGVPYPFCAEAAAELAGSRPTAPAPGRRQTLVEETRAKFQRGFMPSEAEVENLFHSYDDKLHAIGLLHGSRTAPEPSDPPYEMLDRLATALNLTPEQRRDLIANYRQWQRDLAPLWDSFERSTQITAADLATRVSDDALAGSPQPPAGDPTWQAVERLWCEALLPEGPDVINRVTARVLALRASPQEPGKPEVVR